MLAARMYGINDLRIEEMPKPKIGAGEILVKGPGRRNLRHRCADAHQRRERDRFVPAFGAGP